MDVLLLHIDEMKTLELSKGSETFLPKLCPVIALGAPGAVAQKVSIQLRMGLMWQETVTL